MYYLRRQEDGRDFQSFKITWNFSPMLPLQEPSCSVGLSPWGDGICKNGIIRVEGFPEEVREAH